MSNQLSVVERLEDHTATLPLCVHQRHMPRTYFGTQGRDGRGKLTGEVRGVTIPACKECHKPIVRVSLRDLEAPPYDDLPPAPPDWRDKISP